MVISLWERLRVIKNSAFGAGKMAQQFRALAAPAEDHVRFPISAWWLTTT